MQLTGGIGADYTFEVIGRPETIVQAYTTARRGGTVVVVGMPKWDSQVTLPGFQMFYDEKKLLGCMYGSAQVRSDFQRFVNLVETGRLDLGSMVSADRPRRRERRRSARCRPARSSGACSSELLGVDAQVRLGDRALGQAAELHVGRRSQPRMRPSSPSRSVIWLTSGFA